MAKQLGHLVQIDDPNDDVAIRVEHVSKSFTLPHNKQNSIKGGLINLVSRGDRTYETQEVLKDVSFEIKKGEFFGIVGRNGSGKSTLLKMLAGIYTPSKGKIIVNGSLTPFIELGVGFNPELTGRENVYLNGALLGFNRAAMDEMYEDIVAFAELERFMDQKLKNYSSGMQVRLAFSIAIRAQSDVLLIDEVLAVGDAAFQQKCYLYFDELAASGRTIILVTHDMSVVRQFCQKAMLIKEGELRAYGSPSAISRQYEKMLLDRKISSKSRKPQETEGLSVIFQDENMNARRSFDYDSKMAIVVTWDSKRVPATILGIAIYRGSEIVFATNSIEQPVDPREGRAVLKLRTKLGGGRYSVQAVLFNKGRHDVVQVSTHETFAIYGQPKVGGHRDEWEGITYIENSWENL